MLSLQLVLPWELRIFVSHVDGAQRLKTSEPQGGTKAGLYKAGPARGAADPRPVSEGW